MKSVKKLTIIGRLFLCAEFSTLMNALFVIAIIMKLVYNDKAVHIEVLEV